METVATAARGRIVDWKVQIVASEEPLESPSSLFVPAFVSRDAMRFEASGYHGLSFDRLLIEPGTLTAAFIKPVGADGNK